MLDLLCEDIVHEVNQGKERHGKILFGEFLQHMDRCYDEQLTALTFFQSEDPQRFAVEFVVEGTYKKTDDGLPEAKQQKYSLPAASFLTIKNGWIGKVVTYYNLPKWVELVSR